MIPIVLLSVLAGNTSQARASSNLTLTVFPQSCHPIQTVYYSNEWQSAADVQAIRIRLPHTAFDTTEDPAVSAPATNPYVSAPVNIVSIEGSQRNSDEEALPSSLPLSSVPPSPVAQVHCQFPDESGTEDGSHLSSLMEHPSPFYTVYKRIPTPDEINWFECWPNRYIIVGRGSRISVFPDFDIFHQFVDMPGVMFTHVPDMDSNVHVSVSPHRQPLLFVKDGDDIKRLTDASSSSSIPDDQESDYGSDDVDWNNPVYTTAMDKAQEKLMRQG
ncbi:hypothetical protein BT96DRAFT_936234 [Gymnopus androsaceus JB14]|uniref:Uncharacterized protein n=1 Tax=Gymnopus androsaceus JB14 TaxID=1447944 RepID=A0A6A4I0N8_9AGAR|nr:hypothetical protein BT96DRAFT_936234 [Gymnopus androsaceus JB14]